MLSLSNWHKYRRGDIAAGLVVFLLALPLSLGIAQASGAPPLAGLLAASLGGILGGAFGGGHIIIHGPAAGLIVVIAGGATSLGGGAAGWQAVLPAIIIAGFLLVIMARLGAYRLTEYIPNELAHALMAAIGLIIISRQLHIMAGIKPSTSEPLELYAALPGTYAAPVVPALLTGLITLGVAIVWGYVRGSLKSIPPAVVAILVGSVAAHLLHLDEKLFVNIHGQLFDFVVDTRPDWTALTKSAFWFAMFSIFLVQGLETMLLAQAVSFNDPLKRGLDPQKDLQAVGLASMISGFLGGLPVIAEVVRSTANIANGGRSSWANLVHGAAMLLFMLVGLQLANYIPLPALAALLVLTGYRLASPKLFREVFHHGWAPSAVFLLTILVTLGVDLMAGVAAGLVLALVLAFFSAHSWALLWRPKIEQQVNNGSQNWQVSSPLLFSNMPSLVKKLRQVPAGVTVFLFLSMGADATTQERLGRLGEDMRVHGIHVKLGNDPAAEV